ncbi:MAG: hypothetical protein AAFX87_29165 [Bacteroidota bacterium]
MRATLLLVLILNTVHVSAQSNYWDKNKIRAGEWIYTMSQKGDSLGYTHLTIKDNGKQWLLIDDAKVPNFEETIFCYVNKKTLLPDSILMSGKMSGFPIDVQIAWKGNHVKGYADFPKHPSRPTVQIDTTLSEKVIPRVMSFYFLPFYQQLEAGYTTEYDQFNASDGLIRKIKLIIPSEESINVSGYDYNVYRVELTGGVAQQVIYVNREQPEIVKISFKDNDWVYELIEKK